MHAEPRPLGGKLLMEGNSVTRAVGITIVVLGIGLVAACKRDPAPLPTAATSLSAAQQAAIANFLSSSSASDLDALLESLATISPADLRGIRYSITPTGAMSVQGITFVQDTALFKRISDRLLAYQGTHDAQAVASAYEGVDQLFAGVMLSSQGNDPDQLHNFLMARTIRAIALQQYLPIAADAQIESIKARIAALTRLGRDDTKRTPPVP